MKCRAIALLLPVGLAMTLVCTHAAVAESRRGVPLETFRVLFPERSSTPYQTGEHADRNRAAVQHMARMLARWSDSPNIRFVFVAARSSLCNGAAGCSPEHLLWQRVNETAVLLRKATENGKVRFDRIGQAFQDEFRAPPRLLPVPAGSGSIELHTYLDNVEKALQVADGCPWRILLSDPELPPVIGETDGKPAIPVASGSVLTVGAKAIVRLTGLADRSGGNALAVWENDRGEFSKATPAILSTEGTPIAASTRRLHLLAPTPEDMDTRRFLAELTPDFNLIKPLPLVMQRALARSGSRNMGDDVQLLPPGGLHPPAGERWRAEHCHVTFLAALPVEKRSSR
jgi:hypothetical protein